MQIKKIFIRNLNAFRGDHTLDFTEGELAQASLFAIVGATGAGKSTLLDAITLALFNQVPRFGKSSFSKTFVESSGSLITRGCSECQVSVTYRCKSGEYRSTWSIEYNRNNNLKDYEMSVVDLAIEKNLDLKKSEVPKENERRIGLTYDQFIKAIILSQGDFARFLKADSHERGKLLEDLTGMHIYRQLGKKAFEIARDKTQELDRLRQDKKLYEKDLLPPEIFEKRTTEYLEKEAYLVLLTQQIKELEDAIRLKNMVSDTQKALITEKRNVQQAYENLKKFSQQNADTLRKHYQIELFANEINTLKNWQEKQVGEQQAVEKVQAQIKKNESVLAKILENGQILLQNKSIEPEQFTQKIEILLEILRRLTTEENRARTMYESLLGQAINQAKLLRENPFGKQLTAVDFAENLVPVLDTIIATNEAKSSQLRQQLSPNIQPEILHTCINNFRILEKQVSDYQKIIQDIKTNDSAIQEQNSLIETLSQAVTLNFVILGDARKVFDEKLAKEKQLIAEKSLEDFRKQLKNQEPCPLCGSLEHPYATDYILEVGKSTLERSEAEKKVQAAQSLVIRQQTTIENAQKVLIETKKKQAEQKIGKNKIADEINTLKHILGIEKVGKTEWINEQIVLLNQQLEALQSIATTETDLKILYNLANNLQELVVQKHDIASLAEKMKGLYHNQNFEQELSLLKQDFIQTSRQIAEQAIVLAQSEENFLNTFEQIHIQTILLKKQLLHTKFSDIETATKHLLPASQMQQLTAEKDRLYSIFARTITLAKATQKQLQLLEKRDDKSLIKEGLEQFLQIKHQEKNQENNNVSKLIIAIETHRSTQNKIEFIEEKLAFQEKINLKWDLLNRFIGDSEGKKFSTFAQGLTMQRLVALGNQQLKKLSDRYLLDKPTNETDDLMIIDRYMGNERRSVRTLSGGETFLLSLSLALGLSDLASKNVKIESLFIDEGFGTLDPETLDIAISTLENLQRQQQKTIGIISHVEAIKERISTQVCLEKNSQGFSRIAVKAS